jgi:hypothetical protein
MPEKTVRLKDEKFQTRGTYSTAEVVLTFTMNGRELPNADVIGEALESAMITIQNKVKESYQVPERV